MKHKHLGLTIIEMMIIIAVIAILATITAISYREAQIRSRDKKRVAEVAMLATAVEEYYADHGAYPHVSCPAPGGAQECWRNEVWNLLQAEGYLDRVPTPDTTADTAGYDVGANNTANYGWFSSALTNYAIYAPMEREDCKKSKNTTGASWWNTVSECAL